MEKFGNRRNFYRDIIDHNKQRHNMMFLEKKCDARHCWCRFEAIAGVLEVRFGGTKHEGKS